MGASRDGARRGAGFTAAQPDPAISEALDGSDVLLTDAIRTVMEGYADRSALGQRAVEFVTGADGRTVAELKPHFGTLTYREAWKRVRALAGALADNPVRPGDRVATLGFTSTDYAIVDPATLVNHVLPYSQLFGKFVEEADIRQMSATRKINDSYANGYGNSKWGGEVLLSEAHDLCGLPVTVFRCDMILADTTCGGQLNAPDMFTRMMLSLVATGIAPYSFYELDAEGNRQRAHYDGLPVEFIADAISTLGVDVVAGYETYHVMNPYDDGISMDIYVDWLVEAGYPLTRVPDYADWLARFETALRSLPDKQRQASLLPLLHNYQRPEHPINGSLAPPDHFRAAVQDNKIGPDKDIPHVSAPVIVKYITDLELLGLL